MYTCFRLLSELYSFLFIKENVIINYLKYCFRLLSELYSFLFEYEKNDISIDYIEVSVSSRSYILSYMYTNSMMLDIKENREFPSPLGVIFFLILLSWISIIPWLPLVSVSSRSYILSYSLIFNFCIFLILRFRLLSELYSFLYSIFYLN